MRMGRSRRLRTQRRQARMASSSSICHPRSRSRSEKSALRLGECYAYPTLLRLTTPISMSFVPLVAPSTSIDRVKFLASIADSFIYVVSKVRPCPFPKGRLSHHLFAHRWGLPVPQLAMKCLLAFPISSLVFALSHLSLSLSVSESTTGHISTMSLLRARTAL